MTEEGQQIEPGDLVVYRDGFDRSDRDEGGIYGLVINIYYDDFLGSAMVEVLNPDGRLTTSSMMAMNFFGRKI